MKQKLIIFDLDGTLIDSKALWRDIIFNALKKRGYKLTRKKVESSLGSKLNITLKNLKVKENGKLKKEINSRIIAKVNKLKLCLHVKKTLSKLKKQKKQCILALVTNSSRNFVLTSFKKHGLKFNDILCGEDFNTKEQAIKILMKKFKINTSETIYVADKLSDIKVANKLHINIVIPLICSWDKNIFKKRKLKAKHIKYIKNLGELNLKNVSL